MSDSIKTVACDLLLTAGTIVTALASVAYTNYKMPEQEVKKPVVVRSIPQEAEASRPENIIEAYIFQPEKTILAYAKPRRRR